MGAFGIGDNRFTIVWVLDAEMIHYSRAVLHVKNEDESPLLSSKRPKNGTLSADPAQAY